MKFPGRLEITDGIETVDLLSKNVSGIFLENWEPAYPTVKNDGVWLNNPLLSGRRLAIRNLNNAVETFELKIVGQTQHDVVMKLRALHRMLYKAVEHWTNPALAISPEGDPDAAGVVYLLVQGRGESDVRYAAIMDYRLSKETDPYHDPYGGNPAVLQEFTVTIERGDWYAGIPGIGECLELGSDQSQDVLGSTKTFPITIGTDDVTVDYTAATIDNASVDLVVGNVAGNRKGIGLRFQNITVPPGSKVTNATLRVNTSVAVSATVKMKLSGERAANAAAFSTYANFFGRTRTVNNDEFNNPVVVPANTGLVFWHIEDILEEIFAVGGWLSGNALVLFLEDNGSDDNQFESYAAFDHPTIVEATLYFKVKTPFSVLVPPSCNPDNVFLANNMAPTAVTTIFYYDDSAGTFSANLPALGGYPVGLLPAAPAVNDYVAFTCNLGSGYEYPFSDLVFNLTTPGAGITLTWEYWNGAWVALTVYDRTNSLKSAGVHSVHWMQPANWAPCVVNGVGGYWVRAKVTAVSGPVRPFQGLYPVYTARKPYFDIEKNMVDGDLDIRVQMDFNPIGATSTLLSLGIDEIWIGARSLSRGTNFHGYITFNILSEGNGPGIMTAFFAPEVSAIGSTLMPHGSCYRWNAALIIGGSARAMIRFYDQTPDQYRGTYRVFMRRYRVSGTENLKWRLRVTTQGDFVTPVYWSTEWIADTDNPAFGLIDFGVVTLPPTDQLAPGEPLKNLDIYIDGELTAGTADVYLCDLILLPVDEWSLHTWQRIDANTTSFVDGTTGRLIRISSMDENNPLRSVMVDNSGVLTALNMDVSDEINFKLLRTVRYWVLFGDYQLTNTNYLRRYHPEIAATLKMVYNSRFFSLRG